MFTFERLPDYNANLDDILHVGNASEAAPDSFVAQENFLTQLEKESQKLGKATDDDLLDALDQSLFKIYKGDVADWEPLTSSLETSNFQQGARSPQCLDVSVYPPNVATNVTASPCPSNSIVGRLVNKQRACGVTRKRKLVKTTKELKPKTKTRQQKITCSSAPVVTTKRSYTKKVSLSERSVATTHSVNVTTVSKCNHSPATNIKPIQVAAVCSSTAALQSEIDPQKGIVAPDANSLLDLLEEKTREDFYSSAQGDSNLSVSSSTDKPKARAAIVINPLHVKKRRRGYQKISKARIRDKNEAELKEVVRFRHLADHNYYVLPSSEESTDNDSAVEIQDTMEVSPTKALPPSACKIVKWQDYLQRVRLGIRSAPNSPTTSPKIPRGAARKVNNFMVIKGSKKQSEFVAPLPSTQAPKPPSPLLDPLTAVKTLTKTKAVIHLQEFEDYLAKLESVQSSSPAESGPSTTSPTSSESSSLLSTPSTANAQPAKVQNDSRVDDKSSPTDENSSGSNKPIITVHVSPHTRNSMESAYENIAVVDSTTSAVDPRKTMKGKPKQPIAILKPIPPVKWNSKSDKQVTISHKPAPSFKLVSAGKEGTSAKSLVLNNVTGKLEEILSSLAKQQQQQVPLQANPAATAQQQETLQQLLAAISNLKSKESAAGVTSHRKPIAKTDVIVTPPQPLKLMKKLAFVPSPLSLIHEIKQNMSKKTKIESEKVDSMQRPTFSGPTSQRVKHRKTSTESLGRHSPPNPINSPLVTAPSTCPLISNQNSSPECDPNEKKDAEKQSKISYPIQSSLKSIDEGVALPVRELALPCIVSNAQIGVVPAISHTTVPALKPESSCSYKIPVIITHSTTATPFNLLENEIIGDGITEITSHSCSTFTTADTSTEPLYSCPSISSNLEEINSLNSVALLTQENKNDSSIPVVVVEPLNGENCPLVTPWISELIQDCFTEHQEENGIAELKKDEITCSPFVVASGVKAANKVDLEDGEICNSDEDQLAKKLTSANENVQKSSKTNADPGPRNEDDVICIDVSGSDNEEKKNEQAQEPDGDCIARRVVHQQHGLFGVQQNRGLKFSSEVRPPLEEDEYSDSISLDEENVAPRVYESDSSTRSCGKRERKKSKRRKHKHKKHKKKHHRHHHHRRRSDRRHQEEEEFLSDSSSVNERSWRSRKRRVSEDTYSSARLTSSDSERDFSPLPKRQRRQSRGSYSPKQKRSRYSSLSRSRSRSPRRAWKFDKEYESLSRRRRSGDSLSPASSVERCDRFEKSSNIEWDYISRRRIENRETKDQAIRERRVMYVGRIATTTTKFFLRQRFRKFGQIDNVELYFRRHKDSYAFVTFHNTRDAYDAIERGNDGDAESKFDLCFGGRRQFCQMEYADLDEEGKSQVKVEKEEDDFDTLLRKAMKR